MFGGNFTLHFSLSLLLFNVSELQNDPMEWFIGSFGMLIKIANNCPRKILDLVAKPLLLLRPESAMKSLMVNEAYWGKDPEKQPFFSFHIFCPDLKEDEK